MINSHIISGTILLLICLVLNLKYSSSPTTLLNSTNAFCEGDVVVIDCILQNPGITFITNQAGLSVNKSVCITAAVLSNGTVPRLSFTDIGSSNTAPPGRYTISPYLIQDSISTYACCAGQGPNLNVYTRWVTPMLAAPPSPVSVNLSFTTYVPPTSCTGTITLTWQAVTSDREVTSYEVLLNGTNISTTTPTAGQNTYTTGVLNLLEHYATYTVVATSCAGSNTSSPIMFIPPILSLPTSPLLQVKTTFQNCFLLLKLMWNPVTSDKDIISYTVWRNNTPIANLSNITTHYETELISPMLYEYSVSAVNCYGSRLSNNVTITDTYTVTDTTLCTIITPTLPTTCTLQYHTAFIITIVLLLLSILVTIICIIINIYLFRRMKTLSFSNVENTVLEPYASFNYTDMATADDRDGLVISNNLEPSDTLGYYYARTEAILPDTTTGTDITPYASTAAPPIATADITPYASTATTATADVTNTPSAAATTTDDAFGYNISDVNDLYADLA